MSNRERAVKAARARPGAELAARAIEQEQKRDTALSDDDEPA